MLTSEFDYELPENFIAQTPLVKRDHSRLMVVDRKSGKISHTIFREIGNFLKAGDILVANKTRVIPARLFGHKLPSGGRVELLLLRQRDETTWETIVGGKGLVIGKQVEVETSEAGEISPIGEIIQVMEGSERLIRFNLPLDEFFTKIGHVPLPPYIHLLLEDPERYQTVYAKDAGSAAAPTAGLHFTPELMGELQDQGIKFAYATLHVGLDTFAPVTEQDPREHKIHTEWCRLSQPEVDKITNAKAEGGRVIAVGTTSVRTIETAGADGKLKPIEGPTSLYILPGYKFKIVEGLITNFHLPRSTLIMMVSAFAGRDTIMNAYDVAKRENYRFYSFGDAMLIL